MIFGLIACGAASQQTEFLWQNIAASDYDLNQDYEVRQLDETALETERDEDIITEDQDGSIEGENDQETGDELNLMENPEYLVAAAGAAVVAGAVALKFLKPGKAARQDEEDFATQVQKFVEENKEMVAAGTSVVAAVTGYALMTRNSASDVEANSFVNTHFNKIMGLTAVGSLTTAAAGADHYLGTEYLPYNPITYLANLAESKPVGPMDAQPQAEADAQPQAEADAQPQADEDAKKQAAEAEKQAAEAKKQADEKAKKQAAEAKKQAAEAKKDGQAS